MVDWGKSFEDPGGGSKDDDPARPCREEAVLEAVSGRTVHRTFKLNWDSDGGLVDCRYVFGSPCLCHVKTNSRHSDDRGHHSLGGLARLGGSSSTGLPAAVSSIIGTYLVHLVSDKSTTNSIHSDDRGPDSPSLIVSSRLSYIAVKVGANKVTSARK